MLSRFVSGAFHPIIHFGYGIEFQLPIIVAEGLAETAVHPDLMGPLLNEEFWSSKGIENKKIIEIIEDIQKDDRFSHVLEYKDKFKIQKLLEKKLDLVREYAQSWNVPETEEGVNQAIHELYEACVLAYAASAIRPDKDEPRLDFYLMHGVTSVLFVLILLPYLDIKNRVKLLRAQFAAVLSFYISRGRPKLYLDLLYQYSPKELAEEPNPWLDVIKHALTADEPHVPKMVRALLKAEQEWGAGEHNIFLKIAQLTIEGWEKYGWSFGGLGWDEEWESGNNGREYADFFFDI